MTESSLFTNTRQRIFTPEATEAAFPLGGIGTGNISVGARGELRDWEIFNRPNKGKRLQYSFFAIWAQEDGEKPIAKVLESKLCPPFSNSHGFNSGDVSGLPRFESSELLGEYPLANLRLLDNAMPVDVELLAFTPMIPLNTDDSGIPCAVMKYTLTNKTQRNVEVSIAASLLNPIGRGTDTTPFGNLPYDFQMGNKNEYKDENGVRGIYLYNEDIDSGDLKYGNMSLITTSQGVTYKPTWAYGGWIDGISEMWDDFADDGRLEIAADDNAEDTPRIGSIAASETLAPGEAKEIMFLITWYFPNRLNGWGEAFCDSSNMVTQNYYANLFKSSWEAANYTVTNYERLYGDTVAFHDALFNSTIPPHVIDAAASNMSIIRSATCFRLSDGRFFGYEGCFDDAGCCEGNCTHVWNYEQALAFLYPSLERSMRETELSTEVDKDGKMEFRIKKVFGHSNNYHPAADGQMGCIIGLYRDWKLSGDNAFLASVWNNAKRALDFAFSYWDSDGDFVLDSQQHNTYDIEFYGPNSMVNSMFFGALKAGSAMAAAMGDTESADRYEKAFITGSAKMDAMLWNGEYYIQKIENVDAYKYQYGKGCLADQVLGQFAAHVAGLGYILPHEHVKQAVKSVYKYNMKDGFLEHHNVQRTYVLNDEKGLLLCSWPNGGRPKLPFVYSDEVWTGIEYQVAAHLIYEGLVEEGLDVIKTVRDRHDGVRRNPWDEVECGHHYVRAMASWAALPALSGFKYDLTDGVLAFNPAVNQADFSCFFSCDKAWGIFRQKTEANGEIVRGVEVLGGSLDGIEWA